MLIDTNYILENKIRKCENHEMKKFIMLWYGKYKIKYKKILLYFKFIIKKILRMLTN